MAQKTPSILIRTDGSNLIGLGHVYRCIALSQKLKKKGAKINFLVGSNPRITKKLKIYGKCYISNNIEEDEIQLINKINPDIIFIDLLKKFFPYSNSYFKRIRKLTQLLVTIDFSGKEVIYADLSFYSLFKPKIKNSKKIFYGLKYAIVRDEFHLYRQKFFVKKNVKSILILQGGSDSNLISLNILNAINDFDNKISFTLIVGSEFKGWNQLNYFRKKIKNIKILHNVRNIFEIMVKNDIVISAAGNTLIESLYLGIPTIIVCAEKHELYIAKFVSEKNLAKNLGVGSNITKRRLLSTVENFIEDFQMRKNLNKKSKCEVDGKGVSRIANMVFKYYKNLRTND